MKRARDFLLMVGLVLVEPACAGDEGSDCRTAADCRGELECAAPDAPQVCGIPGTAQCGDDLECGEGSVCHAIADPCSPDGVGSECRPPCSEGGCVEGFRCDPERAACVAIPCDDGWACASFEDCSPASPPETPVHARTHGCVAIACERDGDCSGADACVLGVCQSGPGTCVEPMLVP